MRKRLPVIRRAEPKQTLVCAALALLPMAFALVGVAVDERAHLGYSNWLSACRAAGPSLTAWLTLTLTLLPSAVIGLLAGALAVQLGGFLLRHRGCAAHSSLAPHSGCALGMAGGLLLCTLSLPVAVMLAAEALLAAAAAAVLFRHMRRKAYFGSHSYIRES